MALSAEILKKIQQDTENKRKGTKTESKPSDKGTSTPTTKNYNGYSNGSFSLEEKIAQDLANKKAGITSKVEGSSGEANRLGYSLASVDRERAKEGYNRYLTDKKKEEQAKQKELEGEKWWESVFRYMGSSPDSTLAGSNMTLATEALREDTSWKEPTDEWNDEERDMFGFIYANKGKKEAEAWAAELNDAINKAKKDEQRKAATERATSSFGRGVVDTAGAILSTPLGGADFLMDLAEDVARGQITERDGNLTPFERSQAVTEGVATHLNDKYGTIDEDIAIIGGKGWGDVYGLGTSIAQSSLAAYTGGAPQALIQFFGSAAAAGVDDARARGASDDQAIMFGITSGLAEAIPEAIGVDKLLKIGSSDTLKSLMINILKQSGVEGIEEGTTSVINNLADSIIMGDFSNFNILKQQYMAEGMSEEEAKKKAWIDTVEGIAFDSLAGFVSGGIHAGPQTAWQTFSANSNAKATYGESVTELIEEGLSTPAGTRSHELAAEYRAKLDQGKTLSGAEIRMMVEANEQQFTTEDTAKIQEAAENRLKELGESDNVAAIAEILAKQAGGEVITGRQQKVLEASTYGQRVANELNPENIRRGGYSSEWTRDIGTERINADLYNLAQEAAGAKVQPSETSSAPKVEKAVQSEFKASDNGKTISNVTGEESNIAEVASIKNGKMTLNLENGEEVDAKDISFGSQGEALIYEAVANLENINAPAANVLVKNFELADVPAEVYAKGIEEAYTFGSHNIPVEEMMADGAFAKDITEQQRMQAYNLGKSNHKAATQAKEATIRQNRKVESTMGQVKKADSKAGKVHFEGDREALNQRQKESVKVLERVATALGIEIYLFESPVVNGKRKGANGWFDPKDGSIHIDIFAGQNGEATMLFTAAHELVHFIKEWSPAKFDILADFLMEEYGKKGVSVDALVRAQQEKARANGREISYDTAFEEVVADSMETMLADGKVMEKLEKLKAQDQTLWEHIKSFIDDLVKKIKEVYKGLSPNSAEGRYVAEMVDAMERLQELFTEGVVEAAENFQVAQEAKVETESEDLFSLRETTDGRSVAVVDNDILSGIDTSSWDKAKKDQAKKAAFEELKKFKGGIVVSSIKHKVNKDSRNEFTRSQDTEKLYRTTPDVFADKMRMAEVVDDVIIAATNWKNDGGLKHPRKDNFVDFNRGETLIMANKAQYSAEVVVGITNKKEYVFYDVLDIVPTTFKLKKVEPPTPTTAQKVPRGVPGSSTRTNVPQSDSNVKASLREVSDISDSEYKAAEKFFGTTNNYNVAGYLLVDGKMLDFSGKHWGDDYSTSRQVDHRDVWDVWEHKDKDGVDEMVNMIGNGNIRLMPETGGINLAVMPNEEQMKALRGYINHFRGEIVLDIDQVGGDTIHSAIYKRGTASSRVLADIRNYFEDGIVPEGNNDIRYSLRDSDGNELSKEQQEYFKDSKVRDEKGNLSVVYHGTRKADFTRFNRNFNFFTDSREMAESYAPNGELFTGYLDIKNPFVIDAKGEKWSKIPIDAETKKFLDNYGASTFKEKGKWRTTPADIAYAIQDGIDEGEFDYDGIIIKNVDDTGGYYKNRDNIVANDYIVFNSNQFKNFDNKAPTENPDIRYSLRGEGLSNRSLLANAFEGIAQNDIEKKKIEEYKAKIDLINNEEAHLHEVNEKIKELSFSRGPKDTRQLKELHAEATRTANRISTFDKQLLRLEASKPLQDVIDRERKMAFKRAQEKGKQAVAKARQKAAETQREIITRYQESRKKAVEGRHQTAMRNKIKGVVNELNQLLLHGTKDRHVMIGLQKAVAEALDAVNMDTVGAEERIAKYDALIARANDPDVIASLKATRDRIQQQGDNLAEKIAQLKAGYGEIKNSDDPLIANGYDEVIASKIDSVVSTVGNTPLKAMSTEQLEDVYDMYKMVLTRIREANRSFMMEKRETISALGNRVMMEVEKVGGKHPYRLKGAGKIGSFMWNNLKPIFAFERIGSGTFTEVFKNVRAGEDTWAKDVSEARDFFKEESKKYHYDKWDMKKAFSFKSKTGQSFKLTLPQIMSLYAYSKRKQADKHLELGGFVFDSNIEVVEKKNGIPVKYEVNTATAHSISREILGDIIGKLTPEQKTFVDEMQEYLSSTMGEKGNEVSLEMYGVKLFKEKNYFPLKSAKQFMFEQNQTAGEVKIKNSGFSKETVVNASNPVILSDFMDVWGNHVNDMSMYHAFVLPLEDFNRVFSYKTPTTEGMDTESVKQFIQNAYGEEANTYISELIKDLNGGARVDQTTGLMNKLIGGFKKAAVFASVSVVVQQPSAIVRAHAIIGDKYFLGLPKIENHKKLWGEIKKYAPVAVIKEMGYFDTNMGRSTVDYIKDEKTLGSKADAFFSFAPAYADEATWGVIWNAVKRETKAKNPSLNSKSEEFLKIVGERFTEVVTKTQVYDSVLARSANMRSKDTGMKMATAFMAEPTTSINMLEDAVRQWKRGHKKQALNTASAVYGSVILNAVLVSLVYAARDDDEDENYLEKYIGSLTTEIIDGMNPLTYIPFIKDIWSIAQGFDVERADMSLATKLIEAFEKASTTIFVDTSDMDDEEKAQHNKEVNEAILGIVDYIAALFGQPVKNIRRDLGAAKNLYDTIMGGQKISKGSIFDQVIGSAKNAVPVWGWFPDESKGDKLYDAIKAGDETYEARLRESTSDSALRGALRDNDPRIREAALARINGDPATYMRLAKEIIADGFSQDDVVKAINSEINALNKGEEEASTSSKATGFFKTDDYISALMNGDQAAAKAVKDDIISTAMANGKDYEDAEKSFTSSFKSAVWDSYENGELSESETSYMLTKFGDMEEAEVDLKFQVYEWKATVPGADDITASAIADYNEFAEPAGIGKADYYKAWRIYNDTDADIDPKTGEGIAYSKVKKVMPQIDALPLTAAQKTALALCWWAESTVRKYKTW